MSLFLRVQLLPRILDHRDCRDLDIGELAADLLGAALGCVLLWVVLNLTDGPTAVLVVCEAIIRSALNREESRGGHTRLDFPETEDALETVNTVVRQQQDRMLCEYMRRPEVPEDLRKLL